MKRFMNVLAAIPLRVQITAMCCLFVVVVSLVTWFVVSKSQERVIQFEALKLAEVVVNQASSARVAYSILAVSKLNSDGYGAHEFSEDMAGHIPLPSQFLKELSIQSSESADGLYSFRAISKWNLVPEQGIQDSFQRWAWAQLESQNISAPSGPIDWKPVWKISDGEDGRMLRFLTADPAASQTCVDCHNAIEKRASIMSRRITDGVAPGNQWNLHELMGAIEITIPLDRVAALATSQTRNGLLIVLGITVIGLFGVCFIVFYETSRNASVTDKLTFQANHDSLTGLPNRFALESSLMQALSQTSDDADRKIVTVIFLDLDHFKQINDTLGHETGDKVLVMAASRLAQAVSDGDLVARLGGDEFAVLLQGKSNDYVGRIADAILDAIADSFEIDGFKLSVGASLGAASYPRQADSLSELLRCADVAMYSAKHANQSFAWYDSAKDTNAISNLVMKDELREAIANEDLNVYYQPKYSLATGQMTGVEALARWHSPSIGLVSPHIFIALAEHIGLINELTAIVLKRSTAQCQQWREIGFDLSVSVNLSAKNLHDGTLVSLIKSTLSETGFPASSLILEVTESTVMTNINRACRVLSAVRTLGVRLSVDDYGKGHSSLSYLSKLPISELKLDKAFITHASRNPKDAAIVRSTLALAHNLDLTMVAEGVEDGPAIDFLNSIQCDQVQGYFLCRPLNAEALEKRLPYIYTFIPAASESFKECREQVV